MCKIIFHTVTLAILTMMGKHVFIVCIPTIYLIMILRSAQYAQNRLQFIIIVCINVCVNHLSMSMVVVIDYLQRSRDQ
mgnify:CR=1 FL=1|jgi:hypothetical protein